jgi:2,3-diketo-5-methylthio-1-phosphopentane phosphatase
MTGQIALVGGSQDDLDAVLDSVQLDPGFSEFVAWCEAMDFPVSIVSDGVDRFIDRILTRAGLDQVTATANRLAGEPGAWRLELPWREADCAAGSGVCKCAVSRGDGPMVYIGDGRSDFCVSSRADILFAKGALADHCAAHGRSYYPFDTFHDVRRRLTMLVGAEPAMLGETAKA